MRTEIFVCPVCEDPNILIPSHEMKNGNIVECKSCSAGLEVVSLDDGTRIEYFLKKLSTKLL